MTDDPKMLLPKHIREKAVKSGQEWGWREADVCDVINAAKSSHLACLGGEAQFVWPDATCELYWITYDSKERQPEESWPDYVTRSAFEVLTMFREILKSKDLIEEARDNFHFIQEKMAAGEDISQHLVFILDFHKE